MTGDDRHEAELKTCIVCKKEKPVNQFMNNTTSRDGKVSECKACVQAHFAHMVHGKRGK